MRRFGTRKPKSRKQKQEMAKLREISMVLFNIFIYFFITSHIFHKFLLSILEAANISSKDF